MKDRYKWIGLTRSAWIEDIGRDDPVTDWHRCDLFSLPQVRQAMEGAEMAVYMVHSMLPSSRMVQGDFRNMDVLLADNFIRAAEEAGVKRIIYLGGLIPEDEPEETLSPHLASRREVEKILMGRSLPVTVLRAGLIFGPGGSSTRMLLNLTRRLPIMILPAWTQNQTQSTDIKDVIRAIKIVLEDDSMVGTFDLGGHPPMSYGEMIQKTAKLLGKNPVFIKFPANVFTLSRRWVSLFGSTSPNLVNPLIESLRHNLLARPNPLMDQIAQDAVPFEQSVKSSVDQTGVPYSNPRQQTQKKDNKHIQKDKRVRSLQRMPLPRGWPAKRLSEEYSQWISRASKGIIREHRDAEGVLRLSFIHRRIVLLQLKPTPYSEDCKYRRAYYITGGLLSRKEDPPGRFEIRLFPKLNCLIAAIHGFQPRLPWSLYTITQAKIHLWVMQAFSRYLKRLTTHDPMNELNPDHSG